MREAFPSYHPYGSLWAELQACCPVAPQAADHPRRAHWSTEAEAAERPQRA